MERRGSSGLAVPSTSQGNSEGGVQEGAKQHSRPSELRPRVVLLLRNFKFRVAGCVLLVLMSILWSHSLYAAGWRGQPGDSSSVGKRGVLRTFRIRVKESIRGRGPYNEDKGACPLHYQRMTYEDVRDRGQVPYLLGGRRQPHCRTCNSKAPWANFCSWDYSKFSGFRGPVCPEWLQEQLLTWMIESAERGRPGFKEMLTMTPCDLFPLLRGRTLWLMGDSMMQEFMKAMMCFMVEFWDVDRQPQPPIQPHSEPYIDFEWPLQGWCIQLPQDARICLLRANTADQMLDFVFPAFPKLGVKLEDVVLVNFAMWMNTDDQYHGNMTKFREHVWYNLRDLPLMMWRDASVQHFDTLSGDYIWPPRTNSCVPFRDVYLDDQNHLHSWDPALRTVVEGGWRNKLAYAGLIDLQMPIVHTWNMSLGMWNYHTNYREEPGDCTHMCHPSAYQVWLYAFYETLKALPPDARASAQRHLMRPGTR
ncbi:g8481 [Coccomyxa elongata]